jgi:hypothetical protein
MRSGEPDSGVEPSSLVEMLSGQSAAVAVLALCCAERLSEIPESLVESPQARSAVRTGLDLGWSAVVRGDPRPDVIAGAISDLDEQFGSESADVPEFQSELNHAICAAACALEAVRDGDPTAAVNAVDYCRDVYFQLAVKTRPSLNVDELLALKGSPIVQDEVSRELNETRAIAAWGGTISADRVNSLRQAAHADSKILVKLIRGEPSVS